MYGVWRLDEGIVTWRYGGWEAYSRCGDVEVWNSGALEPRCRSSDVEVRKYEGIEVWRSGGALQA